MPLGLDAERSTSFTWKESPWQGGHKTGVSADKSLPAKETIPRRHASPCCVRFKKRRRPQPVCERTPRVEPPEEDPTLPSGLPLCQHSRFASALVPRREATEPRVRQFVCRRMLKSPSIRVQIFALQSRHRLTTAIAVTFHATKASHVCGKWQ